MDKSHEQELYTMSDEQVVKLAQNGDQAALEHIMARYRNLVYKKAGSFFVSGGEREDLVQEGMIGLFKAVKGYDNSASDSFGAFCALCIRAQLVSAVKASTRKKHMPLNSYISLSDCEPDCEQPAPESSEPLSVVLDKEYKKRISLRINSVLSKFELRVLYCYLEGMSYAEIAKTVSRDTKAVDNAVYRIKKKLLFLLCRDDES